MIKMLKKCPPPTPRRPVHLYPDFFHEGFLGADMNSSGYSFNDRNPNEMR